MKKVQKELLEDIFDLTREIQVKFPELYEKLSETPQFTQHQFGEEVSARDYKHYLDSLKRQLAAFEQANNHPPIF